MARKEQHNEKQSKSRTAMRASALSGPAPTPAAEIKASAPRGKSKVRAGTVIAACVCSNEFQDSRYGTGKRVFNLGNSGGKCAVCGSKRSL